MSSVSTHESPGAAQTPEAQRCVQGDSLLYSMPMMDDAPWLAEEPLGGRQTMGARTKRSGEHTLTPQALRAVFRRQGLDVCDVFRRYKRRKSQSDRIGQKRRDIQRAETEPDQRYHGWQDGDQTMQIERDVRGGSMARLRVVSMGLVEWIGVHEARNSRHGNQAHHQYGQDFPGFCSRRSQHERRTPSDKLTPELFLRYISLKM